MSYAYYLVAYDYPQLLPRLKYWPVDSFEYGLPYIALKAPLGDGDCEHAT
jgi:hypothetical protein